MTMLKIVVTGPYAAGKTQFIRTISDIDVVDTDVPVTHEIERQIKTHTTVGLDYGIVQLPSGETLSLFGTPGQERFNYMWDILAEGCLGYLILIDSCRPAQFNDLHLILDYFSEVSTAPFMVVATRSDLPGAMPPNYIHSRLGLPPSISVVACNACDPQSVQSVLLTFLEYLEPLLPEAS